VQERDKHQQATAHLEQQVEQARDELLRLTTERAKLQNALRNIAPKVTKLNAEIAQLQAKIDDEAKNIRAETETALALGPRNNFINENTLATEELQMQLKEMKQRLNAETAAINNGSPFSFAELDAQMLELDETRHNLSQMIKDATTLISTCTKGLESRNKATNKGRGYADAKLISVFSSIIQQQFNLRGSIDIDHAEQCINIEVLSGDKRLDKRTIKTLSGGERSVFTTAFIMSLWKLVDCPFLCMDEPDVFTDAKNRAALVNILLKAHVKLQPYKQLILLTPLGVNNIKDENITVYDMSSMLTRSQ